MFGTQTSQTHLRARWYQNPWIKSVNVSKVYRLDSEAPSG
jgi:hypothetical protein